MVDFPEALAKRDLDPRTVVTVLNYIAETQPSNDQVAAWAATAEIEWNQRVAKEDHSEVIIEVDLNGKRINVAAMDAKGCGHGYRLHGPKFSHVDGQPITARHVLDARDVDELRIYLRIWDHIQARKANAA